jgi:hypothetical protein
MTVTTRSNVQYVRKWKFINTLLFADDNYLFQSVVLGFRCELDKNCALVVYYAASSGNLLSTFRDNLSVPYEGSRNQKGVVILLISN